MNLSPHFTLAEFITSRDHPHIPNQPDNLILARLENLAWRMELVRGILKTPIMISSGYRSQMLNDMVGGSQRSAHMEGLAVDFTSPAFGTPSDIVAILRPHIKELGIDQLILERNRWVHLGLRTYEVCRFQCLNYDGDKYEVLV